MASNNCTLTAIQCSDFGLGIGGWVGGWGLLCVSCSALTPLMRNGSVCNIAAILYKHLSQYACE